jgi:hypothetical protein
MNTKERSRYVSLHSMLAMKGAKSVVCHCDLRDGYCRWVHADNPKTTNSDG